MLNITNNTENETMTVCLEGSLDTNTAPNFEDAMKDMPDGITELIIDMEKLEYISSAGLRVLLTLYKQMTVKGDMKLVHVNDIVKDILNVTGFTNFLKLEE